MQIELLLIDIQYELPKLSYLKGIKLMPIELSLIDIQ